MLKKLGSADVAHLSFFELVDGDKPVARLTLGGMGEPVKALNTCTEELLTHWGIDLAAHATRVQAPVPKTNPGTWISFNDYPRELLREGEQGLVFFRLNVDAKGNTTGCSVQQSTRPKEFEDVVCRSMLRKAQFSPALDAAGKPMASYWRSTVRFQIP